MRNLEKAMDIQHFDNREQGVFFLNNAENTRLAEMTYQYRNAETIVIDHTFVDPSLRGQGVAKQLFDAGIQFARENQLKIIPICSYAVTMFQRDPTLADVKA